MSWYCPPKYIKPVRNINQELLDLKGELSDKQAHITLMKFLRSNLYVAVQLFSGWKIEGYQEIILKSWFLRNFNIEVLSRGGSKSTMAAIFCYLYSIFEPGAKIIIAGPTFRTARHIFNELEKMVSGPKGVILRQAFGSISRRNDIFHWDMKFPDGKVSEVSAIPLSGDKVRGFRANVLIIDEFLLMSQDIIEAVLQPFLAVPVDVAKRIETMELEQALIKSGKLKPEDKISFDNKTRVIFLSSASYTYEYLYKKYCEYIDNIKSEKLSTSSYSVIQLGYQALPKHMLSQEIIEAAKEGGASHANFMREYGAQFVDDSDSYFSAKKMLECTVSDGDNPTLKLFGDPDAKYIVAIDPSFSNSTTSDYFAIAVIELNESSETFTVVHNYAVAGGDLKDHIDYFLYIMQAFNPEMIIIDNIGYQFIDSANESEKFRKAGIHIDFFDFDSDLLGQEYDDMLRKARMYFSKGKIGGRIAFKQIFAPVWLRNSNTHLQTIIDHRKIFFASRINPNGSALSRALGANIDCSLVRASLKDLENLPDERSVIMQELIDTQDRLILEVKKQCALIEVNVGITGNLTYDLPKHLKRSTSAERARKDNYTALLLAAWGAKSYFDLMRTPKEVPTGMFIPVVFK